MSRLADPTTCPDCRATLDPAHDCRACELRLRGPVAAELWRTMLAADRLVAQLRQQPDPAAPAAPAPAAPPAPSYVGAPSGADPRRGLSSASVPVVLLSLGGLCLVVFAAIFLGVAWDALGLWGRSLVILGVTAAIGAGAVVVTRRGLRASAETLWSVTGVMLTFDVYAAAAAGLLGSDPTSRATTALAGCALLVLGVGVALWARRTPCRDLVGAQVLTSLGLLALSAALSLGRADLAPTVALDIGLLLLAGLLLLRLGLPWAAVGTLVWAAGYWVALLVVGAESAQPVSDLSGGFFWWWPLTVASAYAAALVVAPLRRLPASASERGLRVVRAVAATAALIPLVQLLTTSRLGSSATVPVLQALLTLVLLGAVLVWAPRDWARGAAPLVGLGTALLALTLLLAPVGALVDGVVGGSSVALGGDPHPSVWLVAGAVLGLAAAALLGVHGPGLGGLVDRPAPGVATLPLAGAAGVAALALGGWTSVLAARPMLWLAALAGMVAAAAAGWSAWWVRQHAAAALVATAVTLWLAALVTGLALTGDSPLLVALVLSAFTLPLALAGVAQDRAASGSAVPLLAGAVLTGAGALHHGADWLGAGDQLRALLLTGAAVALLLLARPVTRSTSSRLTLEIAAAPLVLAALLVGGEPETGSLVLTAVAIAAAVSGVWQRDREALRLVATGLATLAALGRLLDGLEVPDLPTVSVGLVLVGAGAWWLRQNPGVSSSRALGVGLSLALVPSALLALGAPVSLRGALVAAAALACLIVGVRARLVVPFLLGAGVTALLVLRHLGPVADAVPRWMVIGLVGAALLAAGITWEAGRRNLARTKRYVVSLR